MHGSTANWGVGGDLQPLEVGIVEAADEAREAVNLQQTHDGKVILLSKKKKKSTPRRPYQNPGTVHNQVYPSTHLSPSLCVTCSLIYLPTGNVKRLWRRA